jgi:endonuclease YncB( thermonuclease family)
MRLARSSTSRRLAFGQVVTVDSDERDRYGRLVAEVRLPDGRSLNQELVRAGYAWRFRRYSSDPTLAALRVLAAVDAGIFSATRRLALPGLPGPEPLLGVGVRRAHGGVIRHVRTIARC